MFLNTALFFQSAEVMNGAAQDVYRMPDPSPCPVNDAGEPLNLRIPSTEQNKEEPLDINLVSVIPLCTTDVLC